MSESLSNILNNLNAIPVTEGFIEYRKEQLKENAQSNYDYNQKLQLLNEKIISTKAEVWGGDQHNKKANELYKLEAKIETNLERHKSSLNFFKNNDNCPTCTQPIDLTFTPLIGTVPFRIHKYLGNKLDTTGFAESKSYPAINRLANG